MASVPHPGHPDRQRCGVPITVSLARRIAGHPACLHPTTHPALEREGERSHRVDAQEFCQLLDKDGISADIHVFNEKLREWEDYYNYHRPHGALNGQTPYERLLAKTRAGVLPKV